MKYSNKTYLLSASDLMSNAGCKHLTELERSHKLGKLEKPDYRDPNAALLREKGDEHEKKYLAYLKDSGFTVYECKSESMEETLEAMKAGHEIITQAYLKKDNWRGFADFLLKVEGKSDLGDYHYEVKDTKLASETKATTVLQLCLYTEILKDLQGIFADKMYAVKPGKDFPEDEFRFPEFESYYRFLKSRFEQQINDPADTYPMPVAKCNTCPWWTHCDNQWKADDHLSRIAGAGNQQIKEMEQKGFKTLEAYAKASGPIQNPTKGQKETYSKLYGQAKIQLEGREKGEMVYKLLVEEEGQGLNILPTPSNGDVYFDIEGDRYFEENGIEYLFGYSTKSGANYNYHALWGKNRKEEMELFTDFMEFLMQQREKYPDFHIYHYGHYESTAIKKLSVRYGVYEQERDMLLRENRFVDLLTIIRHSLQASVTSYSLKETEKLAGFTRDLDDLRLATSYRRTITKAFEEDWMHEFPKEHLDLVEAYNKDDVEATAKLHAFLEKLHQDNSRHRPSTEESEDKKNEEVEALKEKLVEGMDFTERENWSQEEKAKWLLYNMVEYYDREWRANAWEYFSLKDKDGIELYEDKYVLNGLKYINRIEPEGRSTIPTDIYEFPDQEVTSKGGKSVKCHPADSEQLKEPHKAIGTIVKIDFDNNHVHIKKTKNTIDHHLECLVMQDNIPDKNLRNALERCIRGVADKGFKNIPAHDLLLQRAPRIENGNYTDLVSKHSELKDLAWETLSHLDNSVLAIQGPPGTGKTHLGGALIAQLANEGKKVGVSAVSHKVIDNLLQKSVSRGKEIGLKDGSVKIKHFMGSGSKKESDPQHGLRGNGKAIISALEEGNIVGGTVFAWTKEELDGQLDYLFVDEAGQMSLANVLAACQCAKNVVLLGDPQQLEQPQKAAHPEGADISALEHMLEGHKTMPKEQGLFLDKTYRLNPELCAFNSQQYYEGRLQTALDSNVHKITGNNRFTGQGYFFIATKHEANKSKSEEEVNEIQAIVKELLTSNLEHINRDGNAKGITEEDIMIVAPYNSQVFALQQAIQDSYPKIEIGTVDLFQGKEAPIVIYSMTSSSIEDAPRGMSFLFDPHRLNVATSRAQSICILVASPELLAAECNSISQMKMANGLCFYSDLAKH